MNKEKKPVLFDIKNEDIKITEDPIDITSDNEEAQNQQAQSPNTKAGATRKSKMISWAFLLLTSLFALFSLWLTATLISTIEELFTRQDLIGWAALTFGFIALLSIIVLITKEVFSLFKLKKLGKLQSKATQIYENNELKPARKYSHHIKQLYSGTPKRNWILSRLKDQETTIMDGRELIELIDVEIGAPLDKEVQKIISDTAKKVSIITAVAPGPFIDMAAVTVLNISMIRKIAAIYGVRPGLWGLSRLGRNVLAHLALSGGIAMTSDLLQPIIGSGIAAKLSKKLGEGMFNGALTIRIGISAQEITRPIPHITASKLSFSKIVKTSLKNPIQ